MDLTNYILPYPYQAYTICERWMSFDKYKEKIYGWVKKNTCNDIDILKNINNMFSLVQHSDKNNDIKKWIVKHVDKCSYISDFSGLEFGIQIDEEYKRVNLRFPHCIEDDEEVLYPKYNITLFRSLDIIDQLEWMYENCEFIPFRVIYKNVHYSANQSPTQ